MMSLTVCQEMAPRLIYVIEQDQVLALRSWKFKAGWGGVGWGGWTRNNVAKSYYLS